MRRTSIARIALAAAAVFAAGHTPAFAAGESARGAVPLKTPGEAANYGEYTQNEAVAAFLSALDAASDETTVSIVGRSLPTEEYGARDIYLAVVAAKPASGPGGLDRSKPTVLVVGAQHGNEQSAKEAALWLLRDLAVGELKPLLAKVNVLVIPQANPYGNFRDVRANELGLDMNRDHVKLEAEGVRAIHRVFQAWRPEVTIDVHEKGDDYYRVSIGCVSNVNISSGLQDFSREVVLAEVERSLKQRNVTFYEYLVTEALGVDTSSGAARPAEGRGRREQMKRFSTTDLNDGRNSLGIFETLSFIQEGASRHDLETLKARTTWQYHGLRAFLGSVAGHAPEIVKMVAGHRAALLERAAARAANDLVHLRMAYVRDPAVPRLALKRFERGEAPAMGRVLRIDKKAGETVTPADFVPTAASGDARVVDEIVEHWFPDVEPTLSVARPRGYVVRGDRHDIAETLLALGVEVGMFAKDVLLDAEVYEVKSVAPSPADYEAPEAIDVEARAAEVPVKKGDFYVPCVQPAANLVPCLLEPQSAYGLVRYWKFKLVPEAGGLFEILRYAGKDDPSVIPYKPWGQGH